MIIGEITNDYVILLTAGKLYIYVIIYNINIIIYIYI